jgi:choline dehydrogenase-like flavoprotein
MRSDVIIVGSGPAAVSAAWPLVESGCSVMMLDAAEQSVPDPPLADINDFYRGDRAWRHAFGDNFAGLRLGSDRSPKFATRIGQTALGSDSEFPPVRAVNFLPIRSFVAGGLSKVWGAFVTTFDDADLRDYPLRKCNLAASYRTIAARIGISGRNDDLAAFLGDGLPLQSPTWLSPISRAVLEKYEEKRRVSDFTMGLARNAVTTEMLGSRQACNRCGLCLYGCARLSIYDATQDLAQLCSTPNFRYYAASRAIRVLSGCGQANAVEIDKGGRREVASAKAIVLAAGTLNTTALVLRSAKAIGVSLRLLSNPTAALAFVVPSRLGKPTPKTGFSLGQLSYRLELVGESAYATGVFYTADTLPASYLAEHLPVSRRAALRLSKWMSPAILLATCYLPGRYSSNLMSLEIGTDHRGELHISGELPLQTRLLLRRSARRLSQEMVRYGAIAIPRSFSMLLPGADGHLAGTLPMTREGTALTCSPDCELRLLQDVFVVDGSCLSDLPAKHCTFTIMANADRVGHIVAHRLALSATID